MGRIGIAVVALLLCPAMSDRAHAFGGLWSSQRANVRQTGADIIIVDNPDTTVTAVIRIRYEGPSQQFAWVIPVPGTPRVAVSSSTVFDRLDAATAPEYWVEQTVEGMCMPPDDPDDALDAGLGSDGAPIDPDATDTPVTALARGSVGPYDHVTIAADPSLEDQADVATEWLTANGYDLTGLDSDVLEPYLSDGYNLLAFKLTSGADAGAIRPVILTYDGELPAIPIRPAAVAAQDDMGIQVWVIGPSQAVPGNYRSLVLNDALIDWLSGREFVVGTAPAGGDGPVNPYVSKPANYDAVVSAAADEAGGHGFVTELGAPASQFREKVWAPLDDETFTIVSTQSYSDGIDAILAAASYYRGWDGWNEALEGATTLPAETTLEEFARDPEQYRGIAQVDTALFLQLLDEQVIEPVAVTAALLYAAPYLTRLYTTLSADEMTVDPAFDYNPDLAQIGNVHIARRSIECSPALHEDDAPWHIELPQGGVVIGKGSSDWPLAVGSLPANLKVVMLGARGAGDVVEDNSEEIRTTLFDIAGTTGSGMVPFQPPQHGVLIGGTQTLMRFEPSDPPEQRTEPSGGGQCSVSRVGGGSSFALALWLPLAGAILALRRRRARTARAACVCALLAVVFTGGCSSGDDATRHDDAGAALPPGALTREQLRDPETCKDCHPRHYREWSGSMHAYAAQDPVFLAMNRRGQRETDGELGDFCIKCHAPMAVVDNLTRDGLDLEQLPDIDRGVSCYFCHNVIGIEGDHNALLTLADDRTMRGPIQDPLQPAAHRAEYSEIFEDTDPQSPAMCGGCHDIVTPSGVHLERTFQEYKNGIFSKSATGEPPAFDSCAGCHMRPEQGFAAVGGPQRTVHEHLWPGVDVALTDFPHRAAMRSAVEDCQLGATSISFFTLEVTPPDLFSFQMETGAGHNQPSGAAQDRRMWLEFLAYDENGELMEEISSGNIGDGEIEEKPEGDPRHDPQLAMFRDRIYDAQGKPVHMFWEAEKSAAHPTGYESHTLPPATTTYVQGRHTVLKQYRASGPDGLPARVTARLRMRPIGLDVLQDLVDSGDLDPAIVAEMPTFTFGAQIEWTKASGLMHVAADVKSDCSTYLCLLDPSSQGCP
jgi:hypothetical protein